jgi:hypothetical protein
MSVGKPFQNRAGRASDIGTNVEHHAQGIRIRETSKIEQPVASKW